MSEPNKRQAKPPKFEMRPDAWERFGRAIDIAVKTPPMHRKKKKNMKVRAKRATPRS
jgi:hypothetical protein